MQNFTKDALIQRTTQFLRKKKTDNVFSNVYRFIYEVYTVVQQMQLY